MNSELTREQIEAMAKAHVLKTARGISFIAMTEADFKSLRTLALVGLSVQPRPIEQIGNGELFVAFGDAGGRALMKRGTGRFSQDDIFYTDTMRTEGPFEVIRTGIPLSSLPTPKDVI